MHLGTYFGSLIYLGYGSMTFSPTYNVSFNLFFSIPELQDYRRDSGERHLSLKQLNKRQTPPRI